MLQSLCSSRLEGRYTSKLHQRKIAWLPQVSNVEQFFITQVANYSPTMPGTCSQPEFLFGGRQVSVYLFEKWGHTFLCASLGTHQHTLQSFKNTFVSRNLDQNKLKMCYFLEKAAKKTLP